MDPISPPLPTTSAIGDDKSDLSCPKPKDVLECHICFDPSTNPVAGLCGHVFCWPCVYKWIRDKPMPCCPVCRHSLKIQRNITPLYGGGVGAGPSNDNGNEGSAASDTAIPLRPSNPLLVSRLKIATLLTRVHKLETERANLEREKSDLEHMNADLRRQVVENNNRILELERNRTNPGLREMQQRNFAFFPEVQENQAIESLHIERGNQMGEEVARSLQEQLDQVISLRLLRRSGGA